MKSPIPTLLYLSAAGLFGYAAWQVYEMLPLLEEKTLTDAMRKGQQDGRDFLGKGKGQGPVTADWQYTDRTASWWAEFKAPNFLGKLPEKPVDPTEVAKEPEVKPADARPLEQIIELVSLVYDGSTQGKGGNSHVILRYKQESGVQPPEWYVRENGLAAGPAASAAMPPDVVPGRQGVPRGNQPRPAQPRPNVPMPTSMVGREILQKVWVDDQGDPRRSSRLWGEFANIRLVRVGPDAQVAYFVRELPPAAETAPQTEPKEEELIKTSAALSQDLLRELRRLQGRVPGDGEGRGAGVPVANSGGAWIESEETTQIENRWNIGRKDETRFRDPDELLEQVHVDTYVSKVSSTKGLIVRNIDTQLASRFGIAQQDVLIEVNGRPVTSKGQVMNFVKGEYNKGVRTFVTQWLSGGGQIVERIYQAPDK